MDRDLWSQPLPVRTWRRGYAFVERHWFMSVILGLGAVVGAAVLPPYPDNAWAAIAAGSAAVVGGAVAAVVFVLVWTLLSEPFVRLAQIHRSALGFDEGASPLREYIAAQRGEGEALIARLEQAHTANQLNDMRGEVVGWARRVFTALRARDPDVAAVFLGDLQVLDQARSMRKADLVELMQDLTSSLEAAAGVANRPASGVAGMAKPDSKP